MNDIGHEAARKLGLWFAERGYFPDRVLCSSATRTRQTYDGIAAAMGLQTPPQILNHLYHATAETIRAEVRLAQGECLWIIGHNQGIGEFASLMSRQPHPDDPSFLHYPSGATTVLSLNCSDWSEVNWDDGTIIDFIYPRLLNK